MKETKTFVVGKGKTPDWFNDICNSGRARANYEDGELVNVKIYTPTKMIIANIGDTIKLNKSGITVEYKPTVETPVESDEV